MEPHTHIMVARLSIANRPQHSLQRRLRTARFLTKLELSANLPQTQIFLRLLARFFQIWLLLRKFKARTLGVQIPLHLQVPNWKTANSTMEKWRKEWVTQEQVRRPRQECRNTTAMRRRTLRTENPATVSQGLRRNRFLG